jgi:hypothetical protein
MTLPAVREQITRVSMGAFISVTLDAEWTAALADFPGREDYALTPDGQRSTRPRVKRTVAYRWSRRSTGVRLVLAGLPRIVEQAGADALEFNLARSSRPERPGPVSTS